MPDTLLPSETSSPPSQMPREVSTALQWFEIITAGISIVVLVLAATMLFGTWQFARTIPAGTDITVHKDAYDRQNFGGHCRYCPTSRLSQWIARELRCRSWRRYDLAGSTGPDAREK